MVILEIIAAIVLIVMMAAVWFLASIFLKGVFCNECPYKDQCDTHQSEEDFIPPCKQNANIDQFHINSNLL